MRTVSRMQTVQSPIIPIVGEWIRQHPGTLSLGQGIVGYGPPPEVQKEIAEFMRAPANHIYHEVQGLPELREQIRQKLEIENGIRLDEDGTDRGLAVCVTAGANMAFMNAVLAVTRPGDEIILLKPYYFNHEMAVGIAGCVPVLVDTDEAYQPVVTWIEEKITDRTRAVVTISPNNPTGAVYSEDVLRTINALCDERGLYHIHDEAYEYFTYQGVRPFSPGAIARGRAHTISLYSLSKAYGFASWRIGYMVFPAPLEPAIKKIQDTILICPPMISQRAALAALRVGKRYCMENQASILEAREVVLEGLDRTRSFCEVQRADGAFYFVLKIDTELPSLEVARRLVEEFGVAAIPGETFGLEGCYLRISYGPLDKETAQEGLDRLVRGLAQMAGKPAG